MIAFKDAQTMVTDMINYAVSKGSPVTDYNQGSIFRIFFETIAWVISGFSGEVRTDWETALKDFIYKVFQFTKKTGTNASTTVIFSSATAATSDVAIPIGTQIKTSDDLIFETVIAGTILTGQTLSGSVNVTSTSVGKDKNVGANTITILVTNLLGVTGVDNSLAAAGGADAESDSELQTRFSLFVSNLARSTVDGYRTGALGVEGVKFANVIEELGDYATTSVIFSAVVAPTADITIPKGTRVRTAANIRYSITTDAVISAGNNDSSAVPVRALNRGSEGNTAAATIVFIIDAVTGVDSVSNPAASIDGTEGILGKTKLFVDDGSGAVVGAVMNEVIKTLEGDALDRDNYAGYRAAGTVITYGSPAIVPTDITQIIYVEEGVDTAEVLLAVEAAQSVYVNSLLLGQNVIIAELKSAALSVDGVKDVIITLPASNIVVGTEQIAKPGTFNTSVVGYVE